MALPVGPIPTFLLNTTPMTFPAGKERIVAFANHLIQKSPPLPPGIFFRTILWIQDQYHAISRLVYRNWHRHGIAEAWNQIKRLLSTEAPDFQAIANLSRPYAEMMPNMAFYHLFALKKIGSSSEAVEQLRLKWEERGYIFEARTPPQPGSRPVMEEYANILLLQAPFSSQEERIHLATLFLDQVEGALRSENLLKYADLLEKVIPPLLREGVPDDHQIHQKLNSLKATAKVERGVTLHEPVYKAFCNKILFSIEYPLILKGGHQLDPSDVENSVYELALLVDQSWARDILKCLKDDLYGEMGPFRRVVVDFLDQEESDPQVLLHNLLATSQDPEEKLDLLLTAQTKEGIEAAVNYLPNRVDSRTRLDINGLQYCYRFPDSNRLIAWAIRRNRQDIVLSYGYFSPEGGTRIGEPLIISKEELERGLGRDNPLGHPLLNHFLLESSFNLLHGEDRGTLREALMERDRIRSKALIGHLNDLPANGKNIQETLEAFNEISLITKWGFLDRDRRFLLEDEWQLIKEILIGKIRLNWAEIDQPHQPFSHKMEQLEQLTPEKLIRVAENLLIANGLAL